MPGLIGKVSAGNRMPYFTLPGGKNIYDDLNAPGFKLLCFGNATTPQPVTLSGLPFEITLLSYAKVPEQWFGGSEGFYILLRPDNHISYIGTELEICRRLLNKISA